MCLGDLPPGIAFAGQKLDEPLPDSRLYRCSRCHLAFRYPLLPKARYDELYRQAPSEIWQYPSAKRRDWSIARHWLQQHYSTGSVLDIGCFDGAFLEYLGDRWERFGVEMNTAAAHKAETRDVTIVGEDATKLAAIQRQFDVIVAFDLIEHMQDPSGLLAQMTALSKPGGVVLIGSGNIAAPSWRLMGSRYWYGSLPEHLAFISEDWCQAVAQAIGLKLMFTARYSHARHRPPAQIVSELAKNLLYRFFPRFFQALRVYGWGGIDASQHAAWKTIPPKWLTAKDHLLVIFQKP